MHKFTREALEHKLGVAEDSIGIYDLDEVELSDWKEVIADLEVALRDDSLRDHPLAAKELENYLSGDVSRSEARFLYKDLALTGFLEVFDPNAFYTSRPKLIQFNGVKYIIGL
jgi:hypothetical protein